MSYKSVSYTHLDVYKRQGLFHEYEYKLAQKICELIPSVEMFRMLNSGTESCMAALRVARLATRKKHILKMGGAYHGWSDQLAYGIRVPGSKWTQAPGIPRHIFRYTQEFFPNDLGDLERKLRLNRLRGGTAAVLIEPVGPESGTRPLDFEFNRGVEQLCRKYGALLILDVYKRQVEHIAAHHSRGSCSAPPFSRI